MVRLKTIHITSSDQVHFLAILYSTTKVISIKIKFHSVESVELMRLSPFHNIMNRCVPTEIAYQMKILNGHAENATGLQETAFQTTQDGF
ncbi:hypothetical protein MXB_579, partial [Myxobolus squamalis]